MRNRSILWGIAALLAAAGLSHAGPVGPLTTFTAGTPAKASEVNGNFSAVSTAVNDNASRITTLQSIIHNFGTGNTFVGVNAGNLTMRGVNNTASGFQALESITTGDNNAASGMNALFSNTTGFNNTASGSHALFSNTTGFNNTASGLTALLGNTTGTGNTASGLGALNSNTTGNNNTASGVNALGSNTTGDGNIAIGGVAGVALTTGSFNIAIGNSGVAAEANTIRIGDVQTRAFIAGIRSITTGTADAINVVIDSKGQLGTVSSSRRVKDDIADIGEASSTLMKLRPVTFHYKSDKNPKGRTLQYGLVAEEVAEVAPGLVAHSGDGKIETVYYQFLAPMLLNEYQKQQRTIEAQTARIAQLEKQSAEIAELKLQLSATIVETLREPHVAKRFDALSAEAIASAPAGMTAIMKEDTERWRNIIRAAGVKLE